MTRRGRPGTVPARPGSADTITSSDSPLRAASRHALVPALGQSDFRELRRAGAGYVDKTPFLGQLLADPAQVVLFPRPRRFGKTLNLSTLAYFLGKRDEDLSPLFQDLAVWNDPAAREHFQRYPVLFLTFKDIKTLSYETTLDAIRTEVQRLYSQHQHLLKSDALRPDERRHYEHMLLGEISEEDCRGSLRELSDTSRATTARRWPS
ncbi:AAA family ATPase [Sorangium atrum]|uniref:AAA family ATPase n=1 Tax=Sorangium atrum TaxID=2995308 RepID=A0ABT5C9V3_9BACT|nr:AAA family ATPase [Sorangium aterium]MDC0683157.1 AAA family ATPase [Sorangium aterium]